MLTLLDDLMNPHYALWSQGLKANIEPKKTPCLIVEKRKSWNKMIQAERAAKNCALFFIEGVEEMTRNA